MKLIQCQENLLCLLHLMTWSFCLGGTVIVVALTLVIYPPKRIYSYNVR